MKRLLIFDLDGTLVDSLEDIRFALNSALRRAGLPEHDADSVRAKVGHGLGELVKAALSETGADDETRAAVLTDVRSVYAEKPVRFSLPYPGIVEMVRNCHERGDLLAVLTNKAQDIAASVVGQLFPGLFDLVQGESPGFARKPEPASVERLFASLRGVKRESAYAPAVSNSVMIGDSGADIETALNCGMRCIAVTWGFRSRQELIAAGAAKLAGDAQELAALLNLPQFA